MIRLSYCIPLLDIIFLFENYFLFTSYLCLQNSIDVITCPSWRRSGSWTRSALMTLNLSTSIWSSLPKKSDVSDIISARNWIRIANDKFVFNVDLIFRKMCRLIMPGFSWPTIANLCVFICSVHLRISPFTGF